MPNVYRYLRQIYFADTLAARTSANAQTTLTQSLSKLSLHLDVS